MARTEATDDDAASRRAVRDTGFSYIEIVVTIVLMGIVVLPILAAVRSSVRAASVSQAAAEVETVLINAADNVARASTTGSTPSNNNWCNLTDEAQSAAVAQGWAASTIVVEHRYLLPDGNWSAAVTPLPMGDCLAAWVTSPRTEPVLKVRIEVTSPDENVTRILEVVKSDV